MGNTTISKNILRKKKHNTNAGLSMKIALTIFITFAATVPLFAQVSTETELSGSKQSNQSRPGYFYYAKPFEVTMTVNLLGRSSSTGRVHLFQQTRISFSLSPLQEDQKSGRISKRCFYTGCLLRKKRRQKFCLRLLCAISLRANRRRCRSRPAT